MSKTTIMTPNFRVSWPAVFKAESYEGNDPKFSVTMLFDKNTIKKDKGQTALWKAMKKLHDDAVKEKWGDDVPKGMNNPFRDGEEKEGDGYGAGVIFVKASSKYRPGVVDEDVEDIMNQEDFYPGCYARAKVNVFAYDVKGNRGVAFGLQTLQKVGDGEPLGGGRSNPKDDFDAIGGGNSSDDSIDNSDDLFD